MEIVLKALQLTVTINDLDDAGFSYAKAAYCVNESDPSAVITGITSGTFSSLSGLVFTDTSSGTIDLDGSTPGTYTVTYTTSGTCTNTSSFQITINGLDNADFNFDSPTYCVGGTDPTPTINGLSGGVFSSTASLSLDTASGIIDRIASWRRRLIKSIIPLAVSKDRLAVELNTPPDNPLIVGVGSVPPTQ